MKAEYGAALGRTIRTPQAAAMVAGIIIGASIFVQPSEITGHFRSIPGVFLVWLVSGLLTFFGALVCAEWAALFPRTGGVYVFLKEAYGRPVGFLWGWAMFWTMHSGIIAAVAVIFARWHLRPPRRRRGQGSLGGGDRRHLGGQLRRGQAGKLAPGCLHGGQDPRHQLHRHRWILGHLGGTVPYLAERLDRGYEAFRKCRENIGRKPSEYLKTFYYDTVHFDPNCLRRAISFVGTGHLLAGSDYPRQIGSLRKMVDSIRALDISAEAKDTILGGNAARLLGFSV